MTRSILSLAQVAEVLRSSGIAVELRGAGDLSVSGVTQDSRGVRPGDLFLAWEGTAHDAHDFVVDAAKGGVSAALVERFVDADLPQLRVDDGRRAAAIVANLLLGDPSRRLRITAITGTNGKTTTSILVRHLLAHMGPAAAIGTLGVIGPDGAIRSGLADLTTPGPVRMAEILCALADEGIESVALEASSHALAQRRLDGVRVDAAVFTNLSRDHLDYHRTTEAYFDAKARLLQLVEEGGGVVVNGAVAEWSRLPPIISRVLVARLEDEEIVGRPPIAGPELPDLIAHEVRVTGEGSRFHMRWGNAEASVFLPLLGRFNVENALSASGAALLLGMDLGEIAHSLSSAPPAVGRMELTVRDPVSVVLDYAHTPHALERALDTLRPLYSGRVIVVFGAGGDRDREKRPQMGRAAVRGSDLAIVTSDNPRTEDPDAIVDEILPGMEGGTFERVTDRREAIARALDLARPGDVVLLAGKGHETYQIVGTERRPFDERIVVREILDSGRAA